jgi:hypothetical protein
VLVETQFRDVVRNQYRGADDLVEWVQGLSSGGIRATESRDRIAVDTADAHAAAHT